MRERPLSDIHGRPLCTGLRILVVLASELREGIVEEVGQGQVRIRYWDSGAWATGTFKWAPSRFYILDDMKQQQLGNTIKMGEDMLALTAPSPWWPASLYAQAVYSLRVILEETVHVLKRYVDE